MVSGSPGPQGYRLVDYWPDGNLVISVPEPSALAMCRLLGVVLVASLSRHHFR